MRRALFVTAVAILILFVSCGDTAIFLSPVEEPAQVRVETVAAGSILAPGSEIPIGIARDPVFTGDPQSADRLVVELLDTDGILIGEQIYESVDQAESLPSVLVPEIGGGLFILRTSYYDGDVLIETDDLPFFISAGDFVILGISTYPATLYPGSAGLLNLTFTAPPGSDPYLEWYLDNDLIQSGFVSETGSDVQVRAPEQIGAYTVRANLFPTAPSVNGIEAPPLVTYSSELLVTTDVRLDESSLAPERNYFALYHFLGDLRDSGARVDLFTPAPEPAQSIGNPLLAFRPDIFGFDFSQGDGVKFDGFLLPVRSGQLGPFSVSLRLRPESVDAEASIVGIYLPDEPVLSIAHDDAGALNVSLGQVAPVVSDPVLVGDVTTTITVSVLPLGAFTAVQMYVDGQLVSSETVEWDARDLDLPDGASETDEGWQAADGYAVLGGEAGFTGIVDEFGVYFRDEGDRPSPDTDIFRSAMEQVYGDKLVYAEGFESSIVPEVLDVDGAATVVDGRLVLSPGTSVLFPIFGFASEELELTVSLEDLNGSLIRFFAGDENPVFEFDPSAFDTETADLQFRFVHSSLQLTVDAPGEEVTEINLDVGAEFDGLRLQVEHAPESLAVVALQSVVAWRENPELPRLILDPANPDEES